jgi:hypothetical protein
MVVNRLTKIGNSKGKTRGKSTCWCRPGMFLMVVKTLCFFETPRKLGYSCGHIPSYTYKLYGTTHPMMVLSHPTIAGESGICKTWGRFQTSDSETLGDTYVDHFEQQSIQFEPCTRGYGCKSGRGNQTRKGDDFL